MKNIDLMINSFQITFNNCNTKINNNTCPLTVLNQQKNKFSTTISNKKNSNNNSSKCKIINLIRTIPKIILIIMTITKNNSIITPKFEINTFTSRVILIIRSIKIKESHSIHQIFSSTPEKIPFNHKINTINNIESKKIIKRTNSKKSNKNLIIKITYQIYKTQSE